MLSRKKIFHMAMPSNQKCIRDKMTREELFVLSLKSIIFLRDILWDRVLYTRSSLRFIVLLKESEGKRHPGMS